jgi:membrane protease YdiL (CAAX protease family)
MPSLLLVGFAAAVVLRSAVGGSAVARSEPAGLVFALGLLVLTVVAAPRRARRVRPRRELMGAVAGLLGAAVLCVPAAVHHADGTSVARSGTGFLGWALVVTVVASAEEAFLRGALFRQLERFGIGTAIGVSALAFAALHVPLYGWGAAPLDLAVGVWLGALRATTGTPTAPAVAHVVADWAAWWLV